MYRLNVPYTEKEEAKAYGARWNGQGKFWYCEELNDGLRNWYREEAAADDQRATESAEETDMSENSINEDHPSENATEHDTSTTEDATSATENDPYSEYKTVTQVSEEISRQFRRTPQLRSILVRGEVTGFQGVNNGNYYFQIKDENALLSCVIWKFDAARILKFKFESKKEVAIIGNVEFYDKIGSSRLRVTQIADIGAGQAFLKYSQLKKQLEEEGLFDPDHKKPIPKFPTRVGIVTSKGGQAIQDIQKVAKKRNPFVQLILYHVNVQGQNAVRTIVAGIKALDVLGLDTIIVGRGGGSDEELAAFNDENVVRAVYDANTPIVSAVGHEGNTSLIDYVSDHRAATPSEAAEDSIPDVMATLHRVKQLKKGITDNMRSNFQKRKSRLDTQKAKLEGNDPARVLKEKKDKLQVLSDGIRDKIVVIYDTKKNRFQVLSDGLRNKIGMIYETKKNKYRVLVAQLNGLSPTAKLIHGFGYITSGDDPVMSINDVGVGDEVSIRIHDGQIKTTVIDIIGA